MPCGYKHTTQITKMHFFLLGKHLVLKIYNVTKCAFIAHL